MTYYVKSRISLFMLSFSIFFYSAQPIYGAFNKSYMDEILKQNDLDKIFQYYYSESSTLENNFSSNSYDESMDALEWLQSGVDKGYTILAAIIVKLYYDIKINYANSIEALKFAHIALCSTIEDVMLAGNTNYNDNECYKSVLDSITYKIQTLEVKPEEIKLLKKAAKSAHDFLNNLDLSPRPTYEIKSNKDTLKKASHYWVFQHTPAPNGILNSLRNSFGSVRKIHFKDPKDPIFLEEILKHKDNEEEKIINIRRDARNTYFTCLYAKYAVMEDKYNQTKADKEKK